VTSELRVCVSVLPIFSRCFPFLHGDETGEHSARRCHIDCKRGRTRSLLLPTTRPIYGTRRPLEDPRVHAVDLTASKALSRHEHPPPRLEVIPDGVCGARLAEELRNEDERVTFPLERGSRREPIVHRIHRRPVGHQCRTRLHRSGARCGKRVPGSTDVPPAARSDGSRGRRTHLTSRRGTRTRASASADGQAFLRRTLTPSRRDYVISQSSG
jgi:hypothetical protein